MNLYFVLHICCRNDLSSWADSFVQHSVRAQHGARRHPLLHRFLLTHKSNTRQNKIAAQGLPKSRFLRHSHPTISTALGFPCKSRVSSSCVEDSLFPRSLIVFPHRCHQGFCEAGFYLELISIFLLMHSGKTLFLEVVTAKFCSA